MQRPTVINLKNRVPGVHYKYVGRPSKWGNPFYLGSHGNRDEVCEKYRRWVQSQPLLMAELPKLAGKTLACFCAPKRCHADILADLVEALPESLA